MRRVGIFLNSHSPRGMGLLCGVGKFVRSHGDWLITLHDSDVDRTLNCLAADESYDGILASINSVAAIQTLQSAAQPVVDICGRLDCPQIPRVVVDQRRVGILAYAHLISCGVPNVAFYGFAEDQQCRGRLDAIVQCAPDHQRNIPVLRQCVGAGIGAGFDSTAAAMSACGDSEVGLETWLQSLAKPVGIIAEDDLLGKRLLERMFHQNVPGCTAIMRNKINGFCVLSAASFSWLLGRHGAEALQA
ncbi:MAG: type 1 periplasmic-binding domain-containing protein [Phycisphaerae bacterium]